MFVLWCNGSTTVFGSVCLSSNLGRTTKVALKENIFRGFSFSVTSRRFINYSLFIYPFNLSKHLVGVRNIAYAICI